MPSDSKKKRNAKKNENAKINGANNSMKNTSTGESKGATGTDELTVEGNQHFLLYLSACSSICDSCTMGYYVTEALCKKLEEDARIAAEARAVTGVLG